MTDRADEIVADLTKRCIHPASVTLSFADGRQFTFPIHTLMFAVSVLYDQQYGGSDRMPWATLLGEVLSTLTVICRGDPDWMANAESAVVDALQEVRDAKDATPE